MGEARAKDQKIKSLEAQKSMLVDLVGALACRLPGDDVVRVTSAERVALRGKHVMLTVDGEDLLINIVTPALVEEGAGHER